jgi:adenosylhomocysteine nucleosidase
MRLTVTILVSVALSTICGGEHTRTVAIVSADAEWREVRNLYPSAKFMKQPYGEYFQFDRNTLVVQGGWGKISAAASTQYVVDRWNPRNIVNLGTCGGISGRVERYKIIAVTRTLVYDIVEQMGDSADAIKFYSTDLDLSWAGQPLPSDAIPALLLSADRDLIAKDIPGLVEKYNAIAVDWESGAIAWTAHRNGKRILILRGVSDMVSPDRGGEAYGNTGEFAQGTARVMKDLFVALPKWLERLNGR